MGGEVIPNGTAVKIVGPNDDAVVVKHGYDDGYLMYLLQFPNEERKWLGCHSVEIPTPEFSVRGNIDVFKHLELVETSDWINLKVDGTVRFDGHAADLDAERVLDELGVRHRYYYTEDIEEFKRVVGERFTAA